MSAEIDKQDKWIAKRVSMTRKFRDLSAEFVARALGMDVDVYRQCEAGVRPFDPNQYLLLANIFSVRLTFLTGNKRTHAPLNVIDLRFHHVSQIPHTVPRGESMSDTR